LPGRYIALLTVSDGKGGEVTNDANLIYITVNFPFVNPPTAGNQTGPAVAIVNGDKPATVSNSSVTFNGNSSWAFVWDPVGKSYGQVVAAKDPTLFNPMAYDWGDGTTSASGTANKVGVVPHTFQKTGNFPVRLTVTATGPSGPVSASSAYSVRVAKAQPAQVVKNPDVITRATFGEPDFLDPAVDYETAGGEISENVYETPIYFQVGSESITNLVPRLATVVPTIANGGISANGLTYTWTFRTGVKFHNGDAMTAADYVFSIRRVLAIHDPDGPSWMLEQILTNYVSAYAGGGAGPSVRDAKFNISAWVDGEFGGWPTSKTPSFMLPAHFAALLPAQTYPVLSGTSAWNTTNMTVARAQAISDSSVVLVNPTTAVVRLTHPYPGFLSISAFTVSSVVSTRAVMENGGVVWGAHNDWMDRNMIGTGPYRLKAWQPNQVISMERWDQWWRPPPAIRVVNIVKVNDLSTRLFMLLAGDADFGTIGVDHKNDVQNADGTPKSGLKISKDQATINVGFFGYNQKINAAKLPPGDTLKVPVGFFNDTHIRKAFSYSFDYGSYIQNVLYGAAEQLRGPIPRGLLGFNDTTPLFTKDAAKAQAELKLVPNPAVPGKSYWDTGFEVTLYYNAGNTQREQGCLLLKNGLEALNAQRVGLPPITVKVSALDWPVYLATLRGKGLPIFFLGWAPDYADPDDYVFPFLHSRGTFPLRIGYKNATIDAMVAAAGSELDTTKREKMYKDLVTLVVTQHVPYLWISQQTTFTPMRGWVQGYWYNAMHAGFPYYNMSKA
jgi:peptide/nickel transport system substrate-binding protein